MAVSISVTSIAAYPKQIQEIRSTAKSLAKVLNMDHKMLQHRLASKKPFVWVKRQATPREAENVKRLNLVGIGFIPEYNRFYPNKTLAAQALGFTGIDGDGLEGIEFYYNRYLQGVKGNFTVLKDALGQGFISAKKGVPNFSGNNLILTIDRTTQYITEKALEASINEFSAKSGMAIVMDPKTGAILAMAHFPFFNPNAFSSHCAQPLKSE